MVTVVGAQVRAVEALRAVRAASIDQGGKVEATAGEVGLVGCGCPARRCMGSPYSGFAAGARKGIPHSR